MMGLRGEHRSRPPNRQSQGGGHEDESFGWGTFRSRSFRDGRARPAGACPCAIDAGSAARHTRGARRASPADRARCAEQRQRQGPARPRQPENHATTAATTRSDRPCVLCPSSTSRPPAVGRSPCRKDKRAPFKAASATRPTRKGSFRGPGSTSSPVLDRPALRKPRSAARRAMSSFSPVCNSTSRLSKRRSRIRSSSTSLPLQPSRNKAGYFVFGRKRTVAGFGWPAGVWSIHALRPAACH